MLNIVLSGTLASAFDPVAATNEYLAKIPPEAMAKSIAYNDGEHWLTLGTFVFTTAIYLVLLVSGLSARMSQFAECVVGARTSDGVSTGRRVWLAPMIYMALFVLLNTVIQLPLSIYTGYFREHGYGMSNQTFFEWFTDEAKGFAIGLVVASLGAILLYAVLRRVGRSWWIWTSALLIGFSALGAMIAPVYLAPLFNTYKSLPESELRSQLLSLARANQIPADDIYVFDASRQTKRVSANVSGLFGTTRISLNDNLLNRCSPAAVRAVMAHEMGHYVLNHSLKGLTQRALVIAVGLGLVAWAFERVAKKFGTTWGIRTADEPARGAFGVADPAALPLLLLLLGSYGLVTMPLGNTLTRTAEIEADAFGVNAAREPDGMAEALLTLVEYRNPKPGKWEEIIFFDHPSGYNRILAAMTWKAEHLPPNQ
ncbi:MAG: M48 family metallopeptidase [Phycisphaerales bacterium]